MGDWSSAEYVISQIFISAAYILLAVTYFITNRHKLLMTTITSNLTMGVGFCLLGGWVGVAMCAIATCRDITSSIINARRTPKEQMKNSILDWCLLAVWVSAFTIATMITQEGFMTMFAYFATTTFTISIWQKNLFIYKFLGIFVGIFWIIYNVIIASFMGVILETALLVFVLIGLVTYCREMKCKTA